MHNPPYYYEITMRLFFGNKSSHIADEAHDLTAKRKRCRNLVKLLQKQVLSLQTTERHKEMLSVDFETLNNELKDKNVQAWSLVYVTLRIIGRLLGYDYVNSVKPHTPVYYQTPDQHFTTAYLEDSAASHNACLESAAIKRRELINKLSQDGVSDFDISLIFDISEYLVKKIRRAA